MKNLTFADSLITYIQSGFSLLGIKTIEVDRATDAVRKAINELNKEMSGATVSADRKWLKDKGYGLYLWDVMNGI